jgi:hypothetical protein
MSAKRLIIAALLLILTPAFGQGPTGTKKFVLYPADAKTKKQTSTVIATEIHIREADHEVVYQVFWSRTTPKRELFRLEVGRYFTGKLVQLWNYGIANEGDFNGDGLPDYSWYGGDDTGEERYLFLSSESGYKRVDLLKTVEAAWQRRFKNTPPDLGLLDGKYELDDIVLEYSAAGLVLDATVRPNPISMATITTKRTYRFSIGQADFKP